MHMHVVHQPENIFRDKTAQTHHTLKVESLRLHIQRICVPSLDVENDVRLPLGLLEPPAQKEAAGLQLAGLQCLSLKVVVIAGQLVF